MGLDAVAYCCYLVSVWHDDADGLVGMERVFVCFVGLDGEVGYELSLGRVDLVGWGGYGLWGYVDECHSAAEDFVGDGVAICGLADWQWCCLMWKWDYLELSVVE